MGEHLLCKQEVDGSIPFTSTNAGTNAGTNRRAKFRFAGRARCARFRTADL